MPLIVDLEAVQGRYAEQQQDDHDKEEAAEEASALASAWLRLLSSPMFPLLEAYEAAEGPPPQRFYLRLKSRVRSCDVVLLWSNV